jgi:D-alanyl-D-alanine carboxypeptidase/D-alanyl-D-alanine-endopeptidase (penicillin-binding protein 4)
MRTIFRQILLPALFLVGMKVPSIAAQAPAPGSTTAVHPIYPAGASSPLGAQIIALLAEPSVSRAHWGIAVTSLDGTPIWGLEEGKFFRPASNAKLYTSAAAIAMMGPDKRFTTSVVAQGKLTNGKLHGNLILRGGGDASFASGYALPYVAPALRDKKALTPVPLADIDDLAAQITAKGLKIVEGDIIGDDRAFEQPGYPEGWSIDDMLWGYGAPISALTVRDNQIDVTLSPSASGKGPALITFTPDLPYYRLNQRVLGDNYVPSLLTQDWGRPALQRFDRAPGSLDLSIVGDLKPGQAPVHEQIGIEDPAKYAALALRAALLSKGIKVAGEVRVQHRVNGDLKSFQQEVHEPLNMPWPMVNAMFAPGDIQCEAQRVSTGDEQEETVLAEHIGPKLIDDLTLTDKVSQNLHAEIMLRNISAVKDCGSTLPHSLQIVRQFWIHAGLDGDDFLFYDGSGLSAKDLVTPRTTAQLLAYASTQPWFSQWKTALPVGGLDGSLGARFKDPPLKDHVFAKTGTLGESRGLSGYLDAASGKQIIFSIYVDTHTPMTAADRSIMDKIVAAIAADN